MIYSHPNQTSVKKPIDFWLRKGRLAGSHSRPRMSRTMIKHYMCANQTSETESRENRIESISRLNAGKVLCTCCLILILFSGCSVSSIGISDFPNNAPMVNPTLSNALSEEIRDLYQRQTRLQILRKGGDLELEGSIIGYDLSQGAISVDSYASESKLTIRVSVRFTNNINPEESFEKTYTAYQTFDAALLLSDVQDELCATMIREIAENIYNDTVAKW